MVQRKLLLDAPGQVAISVQGIGLLIPPCVLPGYHLLTGLSAVSPLAGLQKHHCGLNLVPKRGLNCMYSHWRMLRVGYHILRACIFHITDTPLRWPKATRSIPC